VPVVWCCAVAILVEDAGSDIDVPDYSHLIKEVEMGGVCGTYLGVEKCILCFGGKHEGKR
jgi:hypothetical protein